MSREAERTESEPFSRRVNTLIMRGLDATKARERAHKDLQCYLCAYLTIGGPVSRYASCRDNEKCRKDPGGTPCPCQRSHA